MKIFRRLTFTSLITLFLVWLTMQTPWVKQYALKQLPFTFEEAELHLPFRGTFKGVRYNEDVAAQLLHIEVMPTSFFKSYLFQAEGISINGIDQILEAEGEIHLDDWNRLGGIQAALPLSNGVLNVGYEGQDFALSHPLYGSWKGKITLDHEALVRLENITGTAGAIHGEGKLTITNDLQLDKTLFHLSTEEINATLILLGSLKEPYISLKASSEVLTHENWTFQDVQLSINAGFGSEGLKGNLDLIADDITAGCTFTWDQLIDIEKLNLESADTEIVGSCQFDPHSFATDGELKASTSRLERWSPLKGGGSAVIKLSHNIEYGQKAHLNIDLQGGNHYQSAGVHGELTHLWTQPQGSLTADAYNVKARGHSLDTLHFETKILNEKHWPFQFHAEGPTKEECTLEANGSWNLEACLIKHFDGILFGYPIRLEEEVSIQKLSEGLQISPLFISIADGSLFATLNNSADFLHTSVRLSQVPLDPISLFLPAFDAKGEISGELYIYGPPQELQGQVHAEITQLQILEEAFSTLPPFTCTIAAGLVNQELQGEATISEIGANPITAKVRLPVDFDVEKPLYCALDAAGSITPFLQLFGVDAPNLGAQADMSVIIEGTLNHPHIAGNAKIREGFYESLESGAYLHDITADLEGTGTSLVLKNVEGFSGDDGKVVGSGAIELDAERGFPFAFDLILDRVGLVDATYANAKVSGKIRFEGDMQEAQLGGRLIGDRIELQIPEESALITHHVPLTYINQPAHERKPTPYHDYAPIWPIALNLEIDLANATQITDNSLNSEWKGSGKISGWAHEPLIEGEVKLSKGTYRFRGRDLKLEEGNISFHEVPYDKGKLYVVASLDLGKIDVEVVVKGELMKPSLSLRSNPPMSQREILSFVLFNKGTTDITPFQSREISQSITNLDKGGEDPLSKLQNSIGIDRIDFSPTEHDGSHDVSVEVGKYITDKTVLIFRKNVNTEGNQWGIETELTDHIKVQAEISNDNTGHVNLLWKNDY